MTEIIIETLAHVRSGIFKEISAKTGHQALKAETAAKREMLYIHNECKGYAFSENNHMICFAEITVAIRLLTNIDMQKMAVKEKRRHSPSQGSVLLLGGIIFKWKCIQ